MPPGFWAHISGDDRYDKESYPSGPVLPNGRLAPMMRQYRNLYADLSAGSGLRALQRDRDFGRDFLLEFQDKLLFGRDYFDAKLMDFLHTLELPAEAFDKIAYQNAERLLSSYLDMSPAADSQT